MNTKLKENIKQRLSVRSLSVSELERRAGLKQSTVQNILHGRSKNPSIETIKCIAQELNCSIEELIGEISFREREEHWMLELNASNATMAAKTELGAQTTVAEEAIWNANLFIQSIRVVQAILDKKGLKPSKKQILASVDEIYKYSLKSEEIDKRFAEWLIDKIR